MYTFLFDRKSLALLAGGAGVAAVLLFVAGVLVGMRIDLAAAGRETAEFRPLSAFEGSLIQSASADSAPAPVAGSPSTDELPAPPPVPEPTAAEPEPAKLDPIAPAPAAIAPTAPAAQVAPSAPASLSAPEQADSQAATAATPVEVPEISPPARVVLREPALPSAPEPAEAQAETRAAPVEVASADESAVATEPADRAPASEKAGPIAAPPATERGARGAHRGYSIQVGAYGVPANAEQRLSRLVAAGLDGFIAPLRTATGSELKAVRFGDYPTREAAIAAAESYRARYGREALVRPPA